MMRRAMNKKPFELVGFTVEDYLVWCEKENLNPKLAKSKKRFFALVKDFKILKVKGEIAWEKQG